MYSKKKEKVYVGLCSWVFNNKQTKTWIPLCSFYWVFRNKNETSSSYLLHFWRYLYIYFFLFRRIFFISVAKTFRWVHVRRYVFVGIFLVSKMCSMYFYSNIVLLLTHTKSVDSCAWFCTFVCTQFAWHIQYDRLTIYPVPFVFLSFLQLGPAAEKKSRYLLSNLFHHFFKHLFIFFSNLNTNFASYVTCLFFVFTTRGRV